jgi:hypothetical protein
MKFRVLHTTPIIDAGTYGTCALAGENSGWTSIPHLISMPPLPELRMLNPWGGLYHGLYQRSPFLLVAKSNVH